MVGVSNSDLDLINGSDNSKTTVNSFWDRFCQRCRKSTTSVTVCCCCCVVVDCEDITTDKRSKTRFIKGIQLSDLRVLLDDTNP